MLQSCGQKSFNNTVNPSDPPPPPSNFIPANTKFWIRPCAAPLYTAVTLCKDPILVLHLYTLL